MFPSEENIYSGAVFPNQQGTVVRVEGREGSGADIPHEGSNTCACHHSAGMVLVCERVPGLLM